MGQNNPVTIGIVNFNGGETVLKAIGSVKSLDCGGIARIVVADNCSTDGSPEAIAEKFPDITLLRLGSNFGSAYARQKILEEAGTNLVLVIDNDITLTPGCLAKLAAVKKKLPEAGIVHPHILDEDNPDEPQLYNGGWIHYLCAFIPGEHPGPGAEYEVFDTVSGAALLIDGKKAKKIGGFDGDYFFNWEDGDFTFRMTLAGHPCVNVPGAKVFHKSKPRGKSKVFYQVRNRWYFIFKMYSARTVLLCLPAFLLYEISLAGLMLGKRTVSDYVRGNVQALLDAPRTLKKRRNVQSLRKRKDSELLRAGEIYVPGSMLGGAFMDKAKRLYTEVFRLYWEGVKDFL